ncbi:MAG: hypothetical protein ACM3VT_17460 [Solirubrobacterales bacterium]
MKTRHSRRLVGATHASPSCENRRPSAHRHKPAKCPDDMRQTVPLVCQGLKPPRSLRLPPPESDVWPRACRGKLWDWDTARYYVNRCQLCEHAWRPPESRRRRESAASLPTVLLCTEHPDSPGQLRDVWPTWWCRNFRQVRVEKPRKKRRENTDERLVDWGSPVYKCYEDSRRIKLSSSDRFVVVDPQDYEELSRYKWCASSKQGGMVYAMRRDKKCRTIYMHREIVRARKGSTVDHKNCRIWDNRRCNLRVCTQRQNQMNKGPHGGTSGFVGVYPRGDHWEAGITSRGRHYYVGRFDDPVAAAKARDRKAFELHGKFAYLNFPEDYAGGETPR